MQACPANPCTVQRRTAVERLGYACSLLTWTQSLPFADLHTSLKLLRMSCVPPMRKMAPLWVSAAWPSRPLQGACSRSRTHA